MSDNSGCRIDVALVSLTPDQIRAIKFSNSGLSDSEVAAAINVSLRTLQRWKKNPDFVAAIGQVEAKTTQIVIEQSADVRADLSTQVHDRVVSLIPKAFDLLESVIVDPEGRIADKLKAAHLLLSRVPVIQPSRMSELEAIQVLVDVGAVPIEVLETIREGMTSFRQTALGAFRSAGASEGKVVEFRQRDR